jgi:hypothetical protein
MACFAKLESGCTGLVATFDRQVIGKIKRPIALPEEEKKATRFRAAFVDLRYSPRRCQISIFAASAKARSLEIARTSNCRIRSLVTPIVSPTSLSVSGSCR